MRWTAPHVSAGKEAGCTSRLGVERAGTQAGTQAGAWLRTPRARRIADDADDPGERLQGPRPPDPGVPKVEHEGQWHTLH